MGHWKNRWIQTPQRILMDPYIKQASVWSKWFWIILWPLAYNRLELDSIRKIINFWYTFGWKWRVFVTIWDCRTHVRMTSMTSSVERTDLDFKISVALMECEPHFKNVTKWMKSCLLPCFGTFKMPILMFISILVFRPECQIWNPVRRDTRIYVRRILNASRISKTQLNSSTINLS